MTSLEVMTSPSYLSVANLTASHIAQPTLMAVSWTSERTNALLDQIETRPKYLRAFLGPRPSIKKSSKYAKRLCIKLLQGSEWMSVMQVRGWVDRDAKGRLRATDRWEDHDDPVRLRLKALGTVYEDLHRKLDGHFEAESAPAGFQQARARALCEQNTREWPIMVRLHRLRQRATEQAPPTPSSRGLSSSRAPTSSVDLMIIEDDSDVMEIREEEEEAETDEDDDIVCTGVRAVGLAFHPPPMLTRPSSAPSMGFIKTPTIKKIGPVTQAAEPRLQHNHETPPASQLKPIQKALLPFDQNTYTPATTQFQNSPTLLHTYAATVRKRRLSAVTPTVKISESSRKSQRRSAPERSEPTDSDSDSDPDTPRDTLPREQMIGLLSFTTDTQVQGMFSDPTIQPQQPWRARLLRDEAFATPSAPSSKQPTTCPATGGSMDMDIIEDEDDEGHSETGTSQPSLSDRIARSSSTLTKTDSAPKTPIAKVGSGARISLTQWFRPDTPPLPSPLARLIHQSNHIEAEESQQPAYKSSSQSERPDSGTGGAAGAAVHPEEQESKPSVPVPEPIPPSDQQLGKSDIPGHPPICPIASATIDLLLAQLRSAPAHCLAGSHVCFTTGHIPLRAKLLELVSLLGGRSNSFDETYHPMTPKAPRCQRYFVYPVGWEPAPKAIRGLKQLDVLAFLALVQDKLSRK